MFSFESNWSKWITSEESKEIERERKKGERTKAGKQEEGLKRTYFNYHLLIKASCSFVYLSRFNVCLTEGVWKVPVTTGLPRKKQANRKRSARAGCEYRSSFSQPFSLIMRLYHYNVRDNYSTLPSWKIKLDKIISSNVEIPFFSKFLYTWNVQRPRRDASSDSPVTSPQQSENPSLLSASCPPRVLATLINIGN